MDCTNEVITSPSATTDAYPVSGIKVVEEEEEEEEGKEEEGGRSWWW